ncbi:putative AAA-ATPase [Tepidimonas alkaliphilus]|uniref:Putative AAA-ATPase n=1 Tax=Tepidimonas alkaliphilus TaxID=2588942 RepID=A0A554WCQ3_9BURK|nr:ATP-binding protein [Tepidimonas alkaliphilus]TSE21362.1 putative AAA-ATPase [Tepidimonas alkaliphilus]
MTPLGSRRKLPIGIQTLRDIREGGYYYVDKTPLVARLADSGKFYFLSRPRRFGKSLLLDTIACAFEGKRQLFDAHDGADGTAPRERLFLADHWDWAKPHPVIRISFAEGRLAEAAKLEAHIHHQLDTNAARLGVSLPPVGEDPHIRFTELITRAAEQHQRQAVVLVDEYDKPILDNLEAPEIARAMREGLRNLYSVIKGRDADLRFVLLTGVSKFSKVSIFSGLNNLRDITLSPEYGTLCGYTEEDIDTVFAPELEAAAAEGQALDREEIRRWYNGYRWGPVSVYNPFDVLLLLAERQFRAHWFETGTPTFLVEWLKRRGFYTPQLERLYASEQLLSAFDVEAIEPEALLWQTGYLTIQRVEVCDGVTEYELGVPNREVRAALNETLLRAWLPQRPEGRLTDVVRMLRAADTDALRAHFERLYASIPHDWVRANPIAQYEGYYASVFYSHLASLGLDIVPEEVSNPGQCDLVIRHAGRAWVIEFKVIDGDAPTGEAMRQLKAKDYAAKHRGAPGIEEVIELGVEFSPTKRQIVGWEVARWPSANGV